jgi:hypothetical protein
MGDQVETDHLVETLRIVLAVPEARFQNGAGLIAVFPTDANGSPLVRGGLGVYLCTLISVLWSRFFAGTPVAVPAAFPLDARLARLVF